MAEPLREPGWYRLTEHGWERVGDPEAEAEIKAGAGWDLVRVDVGVTMAEIPLF
jgi:hypothetical protein